MFSGLEPGIYKTKAGSIVKVSGKHGGVVEIDFDWFEENACCDSHPWIDDGFLCWACDCCCEPASGAKLLPAKANDE